MNKINLNWKFWLVALGVVAVCACSKDTELAKMANKLEYQEGTRTANWYTKEVTLEDIGQLEAKLTEAMNGEPLDTLEKLVISGPMAATDFNYLRNNLSGIKSLDLKDASINESDVDYWNPYYGSTYLKNDTICNRMFYHWGGLEEIVLPSSVLYIDEYAFSRCQDLVSVVVPENIKELKSYTFKDCRSLSSVTLPANLEGIGYHVFYDCDSLKSITIPDKVKYIGGGAFMSCDSLSSVEFSTNSELDSIASSAFRGTGLKSIVIPDKVKYIGEYTFYGCNSLSSVTLPSMLNAIESESFNNCDKLTSISIPDKVKYIGGHAFSGCFLLSSVEFAANSELDSIASTVFRETSLKSIVIPDKVKYIGGYAFQNCYSLSNVDLPSSLTYLGSYAFNWCKKLESIDIPDGVKQINDGTFYDCRSLKSIKLPAYLESVGYCGITASLIETLELPSTLKTISSNAFEHNEHLTKVVIPEGVEYLGTRAFRWNKGLRELTIPSTLTTVEENFADVCSNLQVLNWNAPIDVPYNNEGNCLLFVNTDQEISVNECWKNVIRNGVAQSTITINANTNGEFKCPKEFTASEVVYTRYFGDGTVPGGSSGWQTIVLPFSPDSIYHESKGRVAPFGSEIADAKPFWLRELTAEGFADVTSMTPDKAYIIAMPNSSDYVDEYNLGGNITFTAKNVTIAKTPDELQSSVGPDFELHPSYKYKKKALRIYTLGTIHGNYDNMWYFKSFFMRSASDVQPFNAYATAIGGGRSSRAEFDLDTRSKATRGVPYKPNTSGIPQIGDM